MEALKILNFSGCSGLKKFPDIQGNMGHLLELYLASTSLEELPTSIERLTGLVLLDLKRCKNLKSLPTSICKLESLEYLSLWLFKTRESRNDGGYGKFERASVRWNIYRRATLVN